MSEGPGTAGTARRVRVNGINLAIVEYAGPEPTAPPLVLLHGIGSRGVSWWPVIDALAAHFRLVVPDLRGHGESDKPESGYLLPDYAADLAGLLDALDLRQPRLLGHSLGGLIALRWACEHPDRATAIALEDTALAGGPSVVAALDGWLGLSRLSVEEAAAYYAREYPDWSAADCRRRAVSITATAPGVFTELRDEALAPDGSDRLAGVDAIRTPMLLIHGDPEVGSMLTPEAAARFVARVPGVRLARVAGVGHAIHRDAAGEFVRLAVPFLLDPTA